jgi:hypothetical protein
MTGCVNFLYFLYSDGFNLKYFGKLQLTAGIQTQETQWLTKVNTPSNSNKHIGLLIIVMYFQVELMIIKAGYLNVQFTVINSVLSFLHPPKK